MNYQAICAKCNGVAFLYEADKPGMMIHTNRATLLNGHKPTVGDRMGTCNEFVTVIAGMELDDAMEEP